MKLTVEGKNKIFFILLELLRGFLVLAVGGTLWQGLLIHNGFTATRVGIVTAVVSLSQAFTYFLSIFITDKFKKPIHATGYFSFTYIIMFTIISILCFLGSKAFLFPVIVLITFIFYMGEGFRSILCYKIPYLIMDMKDYGFVTATSGWTGGLFSTVISILIPIFLGIVGYMNGMTMLYIVCIALSIVLCFCVFRLKSIGTIPEKQVVTVKEIITDKSVTKLVFANTLRGLSMGIIGCITIMASELFKVSSVQLTTLASLASVAMLMGYMLFSVFGKPIYIKKVSTYSGVIFITLSVVSAISKNFILFAVVTTVLQIAYHILNGVYPVMLAQKTSYKVAGGVTSVRMMITMAASALSGWATGIILDRFTGFLPIFILMMVSGVCQLYCVFKYNRFYDKY